MNPSAPGRSREGPAGDPAVPAAARPKAGLVNVANALTAVRLALVPVVVGFLLMEGTAARVAALAAFAAAAVTDWLDGRLARERGIVTNFGKIADPIADKALTGSALITLSWLGRLPWWVTCVIVFREIVVTGLRLWVIRYRVIPASRGGKLKTLLQVVAIGLYILSGPLVLVREAVMAAALAVTIVTGGDYVLRAVRLHRAPTGTGDGEVGGGTAAHG